MKLRTAGMMDMAMCMRGMRMTCRAQKSGSSCVLSGSLC